MKVSAIFVLLAAMLVVVCALPYNGISLPRPSGGRSPSFPGYGSFNPRARQRRTPGGSVKVDQPVDGRASASVDVDHKVYENEHGSVSVYGNGRMEEGRHPQTNAGVRAEFHWD